LENVRYAIMNKLISKYKACCSALLLLIILLLSAFQSPPRQPNPIVLTDEHIPVTPTEFYIANVTDERNDKSAIAWLLPAARDASPTAVPVDLQGGALHAVKQFIGNSMPRNTALRPVIIGLKKLSVKETALAGNRVEGRVNLVFSFNLDKGEDDRVHLADYNGSAVYNRDATQVLNVEPTLRHLLVNGLLYVNDWINRQAETNIKLVRGVKVTFGDYHEKDEGDSIYYSINRPLTWSDFKSKVPGSKYAAEVFPTLGYDERTEIIKGIINLQLAVKVCLPKSACWVKAGSINDYTLNHEQRHFDIVKIAAEHFKQKVKSRKLSTANFDGPINEEYLDAYREMNSLQMQYDNETQHGMDTAEQQRWNEQIDKDLMDLGVK
jgi:hypothetical protein